MERQLWHGTDQATTFKICKSEFNRSYAGKNGENLFFSTHRKIEEAFFKLDTKACPTTYRKIENQD